MAEAVGLLSGGLDSTLAVKLIADQGIEVHLLNFITPFCTCTRRGCKHEARKVAEKWDLPLSVIAVGEEYVEMVKNPGHGYGKNMNPCIDCRIFFLGKAKDHMEEIGASFIFTGEVLGQRPMSQRRDAMRIIERESGLEGKILRPLSAKLMAPTIPEKEGVVDREKLLSMRGRSRKPQMALAEELGVSDYPCPAGGCRLTEPNFSKRLREAFEHGEDSLREIHLLRYGRHFRLPTGRKLVVGRDEEENAVVASLAQRGDVLMEVMGFGSPVAVLRRGKGSEEMELAASICARYSDGKDEGRVRVGWVEARRGAEAQRSAGEGQHPIASRTEHRPVPSGTRQKSAGEGQSPEPHGSGEMWVEPMGTEEVATYLVR